MALTWTDDLAVGFGRIDEQHRELFARYNELIEECMTGRGRQSMVPMVDFLSGYVAEHFDEEERLMERYAYPGLDRHRQEHREFTERVAAIRLDLQLNGPSAAIVSAVTHSLIDWLVRHVKQVDVQFGRFLADRGPEPEPGEG